MKNVLLIVAVGLVILSPLFFLLWPKKSEADTNRRGRFTEDCTAFTSYAVCEVQDHFTKKRYLITVTQNSTTLIDTFTPLQ